MIKQKFQVTGMRRFFFGQQDSGFDVHIGDFFQQAPVGDEAAIHENACYLVIRVIQRGANLQLSAGDVVGNIAVIGRLLRHTDRDIVHV